MATKFADTIKQKLPQIKASLLHAETAIKSVAVTVISGSALTAHQLLTSSEKVEDLFTPAGIAKIKHNLIYGGLISLFGLFVPSPVKSATGTDASK